LATFRARSVEEYSAPVSSSSSATPDAAVTDATALHCKALIANIGAALQHA